MSPSVFDSEWSFLGPSAPGAGSHVPLPGRELACSRGGLGDRCILFGVCQYDSLARHTAVHLAEKELERESYSLLLEAVNFEEETTFRRVKGLRQTSKTNAKLGFFLAKWYNSYLPKWWLSPGSLPHWCPPETDQTMEEPHSHHSPEHNTTDNSENNPSQSSTQE